jgi:hypothetical protein
MRTLYSVKRGLLADFRGRHLWGLDWRAPRIA